MPRELLFVNAPGRKRRAEMAPPVRLFRQSRNQLFHAGYLAPVQARVHRKSEKRAALPIARPVVFGRAENLVDGIGRAAETPEIFMYGKFKIIHVYL